jgi:CRP-like cAMP-binding protein
VVADAMLRHAAWMARCLGRGELFPFTGHEIDLLAASIGVRRVGAGTPLLHEGRPVEVMGLIEAGEVELYRRTGIRRVALQILREGDLLGDIPFFCRMPAPFSARAVSDAAVIEIDRDTLTRLLGTQPALAQRFMFSLASRLERMQRRLLEVTTGDLRSQVATLLLDEAGDGVGLVRLPQATLAELLGATRPSVNRVLKALESEGLLQVTYRQIEVRDPEGLRGAAAGRRPRALR